MGMISEAGEEQEEDILISIFSFKKKSEQRRRGAVVVQGGWTVGCMVGMQLGMGEKAEQSGPGGGMGASRGGGWEEEVGGGVCLGLGRLESPARR